MKYKIQFKYEMQCGEWDDLLKDECYGGQGAVPIVGTHETMTEYDSVAVANLQIQIEKEDYRESLEDNIEDRPHKLEDIDGMVEEYRLRVVPSHLPEPDQFHNILVWDVTFCKEDDDGNTLMNADGTVQLFHAPKMDCGHISEYVEHDELIYVDSKSMEITTGKLPKEDSNETK